MRLLILDDDADLRRPLARQLEEAGYQVACAEDGESGLVQALNEEFRVILCDVNMPRLDGLGFLRSYRAEGGTALLIMMSAFGSESEALAAMREGAYDYVHKPFLLEQVLLILRKAEERERLRHEVAVLRASLGARGLESAVIAESVAMRSALELAARAAAYDEPALISGERGTGKETLARAIHRHSSRSEASFISLDCAALPESLLEAELFGTPGADRENVLRAGDGGTLVLQEVGALSPRLQARLLSVLAQAAPSHGNSNGNGSAHLRSPDVRVIATTTVDLHAPSDGGSFNADLLRRFSSFSLHLPPLRERAEDLAALVTHFVQQASRKTSRPMSISPQALGALMTHTWPGNVRELKQLIERAAVLSTSGRLDRADFQFPMGSGRSGEHGSGKLELKPQVEALEREVIARALATSGGNRREAATLLGVSLRTLFYKLRRYELE